MKNPKAAIAENTVIGILLTTRDLWEDVTSELKEDDFCEYFCRRTFIAIGEMKKRDPNCVTDILTVSDYMPLDSGEKHNDVFRELAEIANNAFPSTNLKTYIEIVKKESNKRKLSALISLTQTKIFNDDEDYLDFVRQGLLDIENNTSFTITAYQDVMNEMIQRLEEDCNSGKAITGLASGFTELDDITNGLQNGDLIILAARPSMGKTLLMMNIADNISCLCTNEPCVLFSLEMPAIQISKRTLARVSGISGNLIFKAKLTDDHWLMISQAIEKLQTTKLFINDTSRMNVYQMRSYCRKIRNECGLKAVFIDYIGLMDGEGENETLRLGNISRDLKALAKDFNIPVVVLCQLNRKIEERKDRTPMLSDLRQSGNIEQDADLVIFLDRDKEAGKDATVTIAKHRNGRLAQFKLLLDLDHFEFKNYFGSHE